jgi:hypothetical protein
MTEQPTAVRRLPPWGEELTDAIARIVNEHTARHLKGGGGVGARDKQLVGDAVMIDIVAWLRDHPHVAESIREAANDPATGDAQFEAMKAACRAALGADA